MSDEQNPRKNLGERLEDLVVAMERLEALLTRKFSIRAALLRGVAQGLGIILGSTIVAGILYAVLIKFISPNFVQSLLLENVMQKLENKK